MKNTSKKKILNAIKQDAALKLSRKLGANANQKDVENVEKNLEKMNKGPMTQIWDKVVALWLAFLDPNVPVIKKTLIIGGLLYLLLPVDIIADFLPGIGLIDDAFVVLFTAREVFDLAAGTVIEKVKEPIDDKIKEVIDEKLNNAMKNTLIGMSITCLIMTVGLVFVIFKPFGHDISFDAAAGIFVGLMVWGTYRFIKNVINLWPWIKSIFTERGIKKGLIAKIKSEYKAVKIYDTIVEIGSKLFSSFNEIPDTSEIYDHYFIYIRKRVIIFAACVALYSVLFCWVLKPYLIGQFGGLKMWQLYFYPITHIIKVFQK